MPTPSRPTGPHLIGWKEYLDLPGLGLTRFKIKVDTGARTSALHVTSLEVGPKRPDGTAEVSFEIPLNRAGGRTVRASATMLRQIKVTDSGGSSSVRPVIRTEMVLGPVRKQILITLTDRTDRMFRMLLGRKALEGDFVVDVAKRYLTGGGPAPATHPGTPSPGDTAKGDDSVPKDPAPGGTS